MKITKTEIYEIIREALLEEGFYDGTKEWEKVRKENAEVLGYKIAGKPDIRPHIDVKHAHDGVSHIGTVTENARVHLTQVKTRKDLPAFKTPKQQRVNELEYTPADLLDVADQAESLGKLVKKFIPSFVIFKISNSTKTPLVKPLPVNLTLSVKSYKVLPCSYLKYSCIRYGSSI